MKLKSEVLVVGNDKIKWLIIESDENDTKGFFLYYYIDDKTAYDTWHKTIDYAFETAYMQYGITKENWEDVSNV
ncbi:MAG: hypothetical protein ABIN25_07250 [Ginsengibacter sp.]